MHANAGDKVVVGTHHVGVPERVGEILEVRGEDGAPPYLVRWRDDGHTGLFVPGVDATIEQSKR